MGLFDLYIGFQTGKSGKIGLESNLGSLKFMEEVKNVKK